MLPIIIATLNWCLMVGWPPNRHHSFMLLLLLFGVQSNNQQQSQAFMLRVVCVCVFTLRCVGWVARFFRRNIHTHTHIHTHAYANIVISASLRIACCNGDGIRSSSAYVNAMRRVEGGARFPHVNQNVLGLIGLHSNAP